MKFLSIKLVLIVTASIVILNSIHSQTSDSDNHKFPVSLINKEIIEKRGLSEQIKMLVEDCNWSNRIGKKVDVFWLQTERGSFFGHVYEYFIDCDNLRLIYWYDNAGGYGKVIDFMIELLEEDSKFVTSKKRHLKNKKKYQQYLAQ